MIGWIIGLSGLGTIGTLVAIWFFAPAVFALIVRARIPALLAGLVLLTVSCGLIWKWGIANDQRKAAEQQVEKLTDKLTQCTTNLATATTTISDQKQQIEDQNRAVQVLKDAGDARTRLADAAIRAADKQAEIYRKSAAAIQDMDVTGDHCTWALNMHQLILGKERGR